MSEHPNRVVVVGGGQAAASAVVSLRQWKYEGSITLIGEEPALPYQRPPLSKAYMKGELARERLFLKPEQWYEDHAVTLRTGERVERLDCAAREVHTAADTLPYDSLIIATGSRPRRLPGAEAANLHYLRDLADVDELRPELVEGRRLVVVGAGYIGLEAAAVARQIGLDVTVIEAAPRVLARVTGPEISGFYEAEHARHGVNIITDARLAEMVADRGRVTAVELEDGTRIECDLVLVGIGIVPNDELAKEAGVQCDDGIVVDRDARTSVAEVYAAGDVARRPLVAYDRSARLESVHNAIEQGKLAAAAILGRPRPVEDCPWFWSDQFDLKLQIAGLSEGYEEIVVRGQIEDRHFAVYYLLGGRVLAVDAINAPKDFILSKKLITSRTPVDADLLADTSQELKALLA